MIVSYEMFMRCYEVIKDIQFDIIICDEGHRLKNTSTKTTMVSLFVSYVTYVEHLRKNCTLQSYMDLYAVCVYVQFLDLQLLSLILIINTHTCGIAHPPLSLSAFLPC